jgi:hypothetical protein
MNLTNESLTIPNPDPSNRGEATVLTLKYDMTRVFDAENRIAEISWLSTSRAPELLTKLSLALIDLGKYLSDLSYREAVAKRKARERRAVVVIEVIPSKLAEKKLSNNDTNREAVVDLDPEYSAASDVHSQIEAAFILVREKLRGMESAINAAKKVLDTLPAPWVPNPNLVTVPYVQPTTFPDPYIDPNQQWPKITYTTDTGTYTGDPEKTVAPLNRPNPPTTTTRFAVGKAR